MEIKTTLGELVTEMNAGQATREQVMAAVAELSAEGRVIEWSAEVSQPEPADVEIELG